MKTEFMWSRFDNCNIAIRTDGNRCVLLPLTREPLNDLQAQHALYTAKELFVHHFGTVL